MTKTKTARKLTAGILAIIVLSICLCITTFALIYANVKIENNLFETGTVKINLNDGKAVITDADGFLFEPGMTVKKDFFVENESTWDVYYRIYFDEVSGGLSDILEITIKDEETVLWQGTAKELTRDNVSAAENALKTKGSRSLTEEEALAAGVRKDLQIYFYYPPDSGNDGQNMALTFNLCAEATQTKNNEGKEFNENENR